MKSQKRRVADFILEYPDATNEEIANSLDIKENSVKSYISQLKTAGNIEVTTAGSTRIIKTVNEYQEKSVSTATAEKIELKKRSIHEIVGSIHG